MSKTAVGVTLEHFYKIFINLEVKFPVKRDIQQQSGIPINR